MKKVEHRRRRGRPRKTFPVVMHLTQEQLTFFANTYGNGRIGFVDRFVHFFMNDVPKSMDDYIFPLERAEAINRGWVKFISADKDVGDIYVKPIELRKSDV